MVINGKPLLVNPTANWNHKVSKMKGALPVPVHGQKPLPQLASPVSSEYDLETRRDAKTIEYLLLLPVPIAEQAIKIMKEGTTILTKHAQTAHVLAEALRSCVSV